MCDVLALYNWSTYSRHGPRYLLLSARKFKGCKEYGEYNLCWWTGQLSFEALHTEQDVALISSWANLNPLLTRSKSMWKTEVDILTCKRGCHQQMSFYVWSGPQDSQTRRRGWWLTNLNKYQVYELPELSLVLASTSVPVSIRGHHRPILRGSHWHHKLRWRASFHWVLWFQIYKHL